MRVILNWGIVAILGSLVCAAPMVVGGWFALRPSERLLALMRPLSLAAVFAAISNTCLALVNTLVWVSRQPDPAQASIVATQLAETMVIPFVSFGCLAAAWLFVAIGMRRQA